MKSFFAAMIFACFCAASAVQAQVATVMEDVTEVEYLSPTNCTTHHRTTIRIENKRGMDLADFSCSCDKNTALASFSGEITYPKTGASKKIKKNDLQRSEYSSNLATDSYYYYYTPTPADYPFTITYDWVSKETGAILSLASFMPQLGCDVDVKSASYTVTYAPDVEIHYSLSNISSSVQKETLGDGKHRLTLQMENIPALKSEKFMPSIRTLLPKAYFVPDTFAFDKTNGSLTTWQSFGVWLRSLQDGRDALPEELKQKLHQLTDGCADQHQKLLLVYRLLEESTRYVSIQLGIGGLQPAPAADVFKQGFGDCKGLSNFTVAMLKEVGIDADYVVIGTRYEDLPTDFAAMAMLNHAIARVNMPDGAVWMECTNPKYPLGYVHQGIANHNAVLVTANGGEKVRLPKYSAAENADSISMKIDLNADGSARLEVKERALNACFEDYAFMLNLEADKQRGRIRDRLSLSDFVFDSHSVRQLHRLDLVTDERLPVIMTEFDGKCRKYSSMTGSRMFVNLLPFANAGKVSASATRANPVQITDYDRSRIMHIELAIPDGFGVEFVPEAVNEETEFGSIKADIKSQDKGITADICLTYSSAIHPADKYPQACNFVNKVAELLSSKIVLKKE